MTWLPQGYEVPKQQGNYFKFEKGTNKFRVLSAPIMGYIYWNSSGKPVRLKNYTTLPSDIRLDMDGNPEKIKHFWAFVVWSYKAEKLQILEITQATIQSAMQELVTNEDWGDPQQYDITVSKKGEKLDTEYTVTPSPVRDMPEAAKTAKRTIPVNLNALYTGADPFSAQITPEDNPFNDPDAIDAAFEAAANK